MIRVTLYSADFNLHSVIASALGPNCSIALESDKDRLKRKISDRRVDVLLFDLDSNDSVLQQSSALFDEIIDAPLPVVTMIGASSRLTSSELRKRGAFDCVRKPPSLVELKAVIRLAHEHAQVKDKPGEAPQAMHLSQGCDQLIGRGGRAQVLYDLIRRVADLNAFVLLAGESGTGKELVAQAIHNLGRRASKPFTPVSCGAIPDTLIESELFGHEKGAFTGSVGAHAGYLEKAGDGTLFLDEIGELSLSTQVKLLRVLQQKEFTRLGGNKPIPLKARVLFATHRNLQQMVQSGTFRSDLYFRVNVMTINIPPLRERAEDIPLLANHFLHRYALEYDRPVTSIQPTAMELLSNHDWPGNIRELENVIQSAVIMADGESLTIPDLAQYIQKSAAVTEDSSTPLQSAGFEEIVWQFKANLAKQAISECNGNKSLAARKLRVSRAHLHRLIRSVSSPVVPEYWEESAADEA